LTAVKQWLWLVAVVVILAAGLVVSALIGKDAMRACWLAILVTIAASLGGFIPLYIINKLKPDLIFMTALASSVIRLLLVVSGVAIIWRFVPVKAGLFIAWLAVFYMVTLIFKSCYVISRMSVRTGIRI
jgi:hypothetical protein